VIAPLDDPTYDPVHKPARGRVPEVVARWGRRSQLRWWRRFRAELYEQIQALTVAERNALPRDSDEYYIESEYHRGVCCYSCADEAEYDMGVMQDGWCCCRDERIGA
jgi:hypothetical protein